MQVSKTGRYKYFCNLQTFLLLLLHFFFFLGEIPVLEDQKIECSAGHTAVGKVEHGAEECARIIHPRKLVVEQRKIEHIHHLGSLTLS